LFTLFAIFYLCYNLSWFFFSKGFFETIFLKLIFHLKIFVLILKFIFFWVNIFWSSLFRSYMEWFFPIYMREKGDIFEFRIFSLPRMEKSFLIALQQCQLLSSFVGKTRPIVSHSGLNSKFSFIVKISINFHFFHQFLWKTECAYMYGTHTLQTSSTTFLSQFLSSNNWWTWTRKRICLE
jgi:hypothetical protein